MLDLSGRGDENVKQVCSTALNQVPPDMVQLDDKMVNVLVSLLTATGSTATDDGSIAVPEPSAHDLIPWTLRSASVRENPVEAQPSWINYVCQGFEVRTFYTLILILVIFAGALKFNLTLRYYIPPTPTTLR